MEFRRITPQGRSSIAGLSALNLSRQGQIIPALRDEVRPYWLPGRQHALIFTGIEFTGIEDARPSGAVDIPWLLGAFRAPAPWMVNRGHHRRHHRNTEAGPHGSSPGSSPSCNTFVPKLHRPTVSNPTDSPGAAGDALLRCGPRTAALSFNEVSLAKSLNLP